MKKFFLLNLLIVFILSFTTGCSLLPKKSDTQTQQQSIINTTPSTSEKNIDVETSYIYSATGQKDIEPKEIVAWNFGTLNKYFADAVYGSVIKCNSGIENNENAAKLVFLMENGFLEDYSSMKFKIKSDNYKSIGIFVEKDGGPYLNKSIKISKEWQELTIDLSSIGKEALLNKCDKILFVGDGPGTIYLTDFKLIK